MLEVTFEFLQNLRPENTTQSVTITVSYVPEPTPTGKS